MDPALATAALQQKSAPTTETPPAAASTTPSTPQQRKSKWGRAIAAVKIGNAFKRSARNARAESEGIKRQRSWRKRNSTNETETVPASGALDQVRNRRSARKSVLLDFDVPVVGRSGSGSGGASKYEIGAPGRKDKAGGEVDLTEIGVQVLLEALGQVPSNGGLRSKIDLSDPELMLTSRAFEEIGYISGERVTKRDSRRPQQQQQRRRRQQQQQQQVSMQQAVTRASLDTVSDMVLSFNQLDSLLPIALRADGSRAFQNLEVLLVDHNSLACICPGFRSQLDYNAWPYEMRSLLHLNLSYNRMADIPDLTLMPNLQILNLRHNRITLFSFPNVSQGHRLQVLDISENHLAWSPREFVQDLVHLHHCRDMRRICFAHNPFISQLENYVMFVVKSMFDLDLVTRQGLRPSALTFVDGVQIRPGMKFDAINLNLSEDQFFAGRSPIILGADPSDIFDRNDDESSGGSGGSGGGNGGGGSGGGGGGGGGGRGNDTGGNRSSGSAAVPASREEAGITVLTSKDKMWRINVGSEQSGQALLDGRLPAPKFSQIFLSMQLAMKRPRDARKEVRRALMLCHVIASLPEAHSHIVWELVDDEFSAFEDVHMRFQHILEVR
jgi:uncharacterized membrane protein YgcG